MTISRNLLTHDIVVLTGAENGFMQNSGDSSITPGVLVALGKKASVIFTTTFLRLLMYSSAVYAKWVETGLGNHTF